MVRFRKLLPAAMALAAAVLLAAPPSARANITIQISTDGGATFDAGGSGVGSAFDTATFGTVTILVTATSNQPANSPNAQIQQVQIDTNNSGSSAQSLALVVRISDQSFTLPVGPSTLSSSFSGTTGPNVTAPGATFQSTVDYSNTLFGGLPGIVTPGPTDSPGPQTVIIPNIPSGTQGFNATATVHTNATPNFSLSNEFTLANLTIGAASSLQLTGTTNLSAVPAPATMVLALGSLPLLGFGGWLRRRKQA